MTRQQYENGDPWTHTNIMKLSNLLFLFSWVNFGSVRPSVSCLKDAIETKAMGKIEFWQDDIRQNVCNNKTKCVKPGRTWQLTICLAWMHVFNSFCASCLKDALKPKLYRINRILTSYKMPSFKLQFSLSFLMSCYVIMNISIAWTIDKLKTT